MYESYGLVDYMLFDGDEIADTFESIIDTVREVWELTMLCATYLTTSMRYLAIQLLVYLR